MSSSSVDLRWVKRRLEDVVDSSSMDFEVLASHLMSQSNEKEMRAEARSMLLVDDGPDFYRKRVNKCLDEISARLYAKKKQEKKIKIGAKHGPVNCLRCGFVNSVPMTQNASIGDYHIFMEHINLTRDRWSRCVACGEKMSEQLRYGDGDDNPDLIASIRTAAKLIAFDRQATERTRVVDDQADWYKTPSAALSSSYRQPTFTIDFAGRKLMLTEDPEPLTTTGVAATGPPPDLFNRSMKHSATSQFNS